MKKIFIIGLFVVSGFLNASEIEQVSDETEQVLDSQEHNGEVADSHKKFFCSDCGKGFTNQSNLRRHQKNKIGERLFQCDFEGCGKAFTKIGNLEIHQRTHTGEKPYLCEFVFCGKAFAELVNLNRHEKIHTGEKSYLCKFEGCFEAFTRVWNLKRHEKIHRGEKLYQCNNCDKNFIDESNFKRHQIVHTGERRYLCEVAGCGKSFTQLGSLKKHSKNQHKDLVN